MQQPIYFDYNATTPLNNEVVEAMLPYLNQYFGNPSSVNYFGNLTRTAVDNAREQVADFLTCSPGEIVFTSGGTESNNMAIKGLAFTLKKKGNHIITTAIEHPAVLEVCRDLEQYGFEITIVPVNNIGIVDTEDVKKAIKSNTILISVMHANNETGAIQPISEISALSKEYNICLHSDAAQSAGKIPVHVKELGVDLLSLAGHKLYSPKGIGVLYIKEGIQLHKLMQGAGQEKGRRPGTENILGIVGLGKACEIAKRDFEKTHKHLKELRNMLYYGLKEQLNEDIKLNGELDKILPNTLNISFKGIIANNLVDILKEEVILSAGAACHSGITKISDVLTAMKVAQSWAQGAIRISLGKITTEEEVNTAIGLIAKAYRSLQGK